MSRGKKNESIGLKVSKRKINMFLLVASFLLISQHFNLASLSLIPQVQAQIHSLTNLTTDLKDKDVAEFENEVNTEQEVVTVEADFELPKNNLETKTIQEDPSLDANLEIPQTNLEVETANEPPQFSQEESSQAGELDLESSPPTEVSEEAEKTEKLEEDLEARNSFSQSEAKVDNWAGFVGAYNSSEVKKITLLNNIEATTSDELIARTTTIEINGNGKTLALDGSQSLPIAAPEDKETPVFHMHSIHLGSTNTAEDGKEAQSFIGGGDISSEHTRRWKFRLGYITNDSKILRILRAYQAEVSLYGTLTLETRGSNFYVGSLTIEERGYYKGKVLKLDEPIIWFKEESVSSDNTGSKEELKIKNGGSLLLSKPYDLESTYSAIHGFWSDLTVEKGILDIRTHGPAIGYGRDGGRVIIKEGSSLIIEVPSIPSGSTAPIGFPEVKSVIDFSSTKNSSFISEPGAYIYIKGEANGGNGIVDMSGEGNTFTITKPLSTIDRPASYDIANTGTGSAFVLGTNSKVSISDADITLHEKTIGLMNYFHVENFEVTSNEESHSQDSTSTDVNLQSMFTNMKDYKRIAGTSVRPIVEFVGAITDADYTIRARVEIGEVYKRDEQGLTVRETIYAKEGEATIKLTETDGTVHDALPVGNDGYVNVTADNFQLAKKDISAVATRGTWVQKDPTSKKVLDVTPPEIANVDLKYIDKHTQEITGTSSEKPAQVIITINDDSLPDKEETILTSEVDDNGKWAITLPEPLVVGQKIQILLNDHSGPLPENELSDPPITNNKLGNQNPAEAVSYRDAIFPAGPIFYVIEEFSGELTLVAPTTMSFGENLQISSQDKRYPLSNQEQLGVKDTRVPQSSWSLKATLVKEIKHEDHDSVLSLIYQRDNKDNLLTQNAIEIYRHTSIGDSLFSISDTWYNQSGDGLYIDVKAGAARAGKYTGTIQWTLEDVPING